MAKQEYHVVSLSGGKDSTAMLLKMLEKGMQVDCILFCDTGLEFPAMYAHLEKLEKYIGREITRVRAPYDFEYYFKDYPIQKRTERFVKRYGEGRNGYGWAGSKMRWCTARLKDQPRERFLAALRKEYEVIEYVGIAADEQYRLERKTNQRDSCRHPLVEWGMTEADCLRYCYDHGFDWDGLYLLFTRVSCWCCPLQSLSELRKLYDHFPALWEKLRYWDSCTWRKFRPDYSVLELEVRFKFEDEWKAAGKLLGTREFYRELRARLPKEGEANGRK